MNWALSIERETIADVTLVEEVDRALEPGEARLAVRRFALTANNITYAAFGTVMRYWDFFPGADQRGRLPVWGFAEVIESRAEGLQDGERIYGYFPAGSELIVRPERIDAASFVDAAPHRAELPSAYNRYQRCKADPAWSEAVEPAQMVLQPLFITSFLIAPYLREQTAFGAQTIALTSASSKTAIALAWLLKAQPIAGVKVEALTSARNAGFVSGLGIYDSVRTYDDIEDMPTDGVYAVVDFAGDGGLNTRLHTHLGAALKANVRVGGAHWENSAPVGDLPGVKPEFFFAPDHVRTKIKEWGQDEFNRRYKADWDGFAKAAAEYFDYTEAAGGEGALEVYQALIRGAVPASSAETVRV
ncbi:DUF2855 family protein [Maricaulis sp.]|uniref:DUF2855 family protein n=1 Tax=Maricaulis sp. TaxID=1486257 RepID=UPI00261247EE|nr:DUF2855 family protein [Maricaulis sp.]